MITNVDRFSTILPSKDTYVLKSLTGQEMQYLGVSPLVQVVLPDTTRDLYTFVYVESGTVHQVDINSDLEVIYLDGTEQTEPFLKASYAFKEAKFSIMLSVFDQESKYKYSAPVFISEAQVFGTINEQNYDRAEQIFKDRFLGAINLKFTRDENGLLSVEACVVNKGVIPDFS